MQHQQQNLNLSIFPELVAVSKQTAGAQLAPSHTSAPLPEPLMTTVAR